jgi:hypothetical protein
MDDFAYRSAGAPSQAMPYLWGRFVKRDDLIFIWAPRVSRFRDLILAGTLPGQLREGEGDAYLGALTEEDYDVIVSEAEGGLFEWEAPAVLIPMGD